MEQNNLTNENILSEETIGFIKKCYIHLNQARQGVWAFADLAEIVWNPKLQKKNKELYFSIIHDAIAYEIIKYEEILEMSELKNDFLAFYSKFVSKINTSHEYTNFLEDRITTLENRFGLVWKEQEEQLLKIVSEDEIILGVGKFLINKEYEFDGESKDKKKKFIKNKEGKQFILTRKRGDSFLYFCKELNQLFLLYSVQSKVNVYSFVENHFTKYYPILVKKGDNFGFGEVRDNLLIEGDNYFALQLLQFTHRGKIDVIYIDPPYNTGNGDFKYNDAYVGSDDGSRHSKWLSFMEKRLKLAKELLEENGFIAIQIDGNELSNLKMICDQIFNESNFISMITVKMSNESGPKMAHITKGIIKVNEYILLYAKNKPIEIKPAYIQKDKWDNEYKHIIGNFPKEIYEEIQNGNLNEEGLDSINKKLLGLKLQNINEWFKENKISFSSNDEKEKWLYDNKWRIFRDSNSDSIKKIADNINFTNNQNIAVIFSSDKLPVLIRTDYNKQASNPRLQLVNLKNTVVLGDLWTDITTSGLHTEGGINFKNGKKPINLLKRIFSLHPNKNAVILDFFAGSGSSGHALISLNKEDGGNRKYIVCTNNENNICEETTFKRLNNVNVLNNLEHGLKYLQIKHISDLDLENADDIGNFEYVKQINNIKFNATKIIKENEYVYITNTYSVFKKSNKNKQKEYCEFFEQSRRENITNLVFVSSDRTEYDYFRKVISDYISTLEENQLFEKIKYYQMSKNYMDNMLSIINGEEEIDVEKYMVDEENQENGEQQ